MDGGYKMRGSQTSQEPSVVSQSSQRWTVASVNPGCFWPCCGLGYGVLRKRVLLDGAKHAHSPGIREVPGGSMRELNLLAGYCLMAHREGQWVTTTVCDLQNGHCFTCNFSQETPVVHPKRKHTHNGSSGKHIQPRWLTHLRKNFGKADLHVFPQIYLLICCPCLIKCWPQIQPGGGEPMKGNGQPCFTTPAPKMMFYIILRPKPQRDSVS